MATTRQVQEEDEEKRPVGQVQEGGETTATTKPLQDDYVSVSDNKLVWTANLITMVISAILPVISVIILYFVHSMIARLGIVAAFTAVFVLTLAVVTDACGVEIFAATAGFAAVQVVFIGSTSLEGS